MGRLKESLENGPSNRHLMGEIPSSSPVFQFYSTLDLKCPRKINVWMFSPQGSKVQTWGHWLWLCHWINLLENGAQFRKQVTGGMFLKTLFCPWSFSFHHLSLLLVHHEINGSLPLWGPHHDLMPYRSLRVTCAEAARPTSPNKAVFPWTCLPQVFLSQWQKLTQFPTQCPSVSRSAFHH